jgi:hypothetical protein
MQMPQDDRVTIKFVRDFQTSDGSVNYTKDSECLVDPATAAALLLAGAAVKVAATADPIADRGAQMPPPPDGGS